MPFYIFVCRVCFQVVFWDVLDDFYFLYALETSTKSLCKSRERGACDVDVAGQPNMGLLVCILNNLHSSLSAGAGRYDGAGKERGT